MRGFRLLSCALAFGLTAPTFSSTLTPSYNRDKESIKAMAGCYEVTYQNAETFALTKNYTYHDRYKSGALELIVVDDEDQNTVGLQHLLIVPGSIIKHWRQVWTYEGEELFDFHPPLLWTKRKLEAPAAQQWTQQVYQVDDSPRYECVAPWIHYSNTHFWECESDAPLPRREATKRSDYNILRRKNRHEITSTGHTHDENNTKIFQDHTASKLPLAMEKGMNVYKKVADEKCQAATSWWKEHRQFWKDVQEVWKEIYAREDRLQFREKVGEQVLWEKLFELDEKYSSGPGYSSQRVREESKKTILEYLIFAH